MDTFTIRKETNIFIFNDNYERLNKYICEMNSIREDMCKQNFSNMNEGRMKIYLLTRKAMCIIKLLEKLFFEYNMIIYADEEYMNGYSFEKSLIMATRTISNYNRWIDNLWRLNIIKNMFSH